MMSIAWDSCVDEGSVREHQDAFRYGVIKLVSWPDLTQVPEQEQPLVARICALLSRKLSAGRLVPLVLAAPESDVFRAMSALVRSGHLTVTTGGVVDSSDQGASRDVDVHVTSGLSSTLPSAGASRRRSLIGKLWARFTS